jgi:LPS-assembly lipoprotein
LRGRFELEAPDNRNAFTLVGRLEERLGRPEGPDLRLTYDIVLESDELAISSANNIERYNIIGRIGYTVSRVGSPAVLTRGAVENFTSYSTTALTVGTLAAEEDARERLMILLADQIVAQLLATAGEWMPPR